MIKINIQYSITKEIERVIHTANRIDIFAERGYKLEELLSPKNIPYQDIKLMTKNEITKLITEDYITEDYDKNIKYIQNRWLQIEPKFKSEIEKMKIEIIPEFDIIFTKYGITGSYESPNIIFVNIKKFYNEGVLRIIIHELIHLLIHRYILKYKIEHWSKERIVDLIFLDFFPELSKMQVISNTEDLDELFYEYFPNIEKAIFEISKIKKQNIYGYNL